jgi:hypothetical protein
MITKGNYFNVASFFAGKVNGFLKYCLPVVFVSLLVWKHSSASTENISPGNFLQQELTLLSPDLPFHSFISPFHFPFESAPIPAEQEIPDEYELDDDTDFDSYASLEGYSMEDIYSGSLLKNILSLPYSSTQNRTKVPFFILYHSWKSFMV